jgi:hypothetical protein
MKIISLLLASLLTLFFSHMAFAIAVEPVINKNVHVMQNTTPAQCPSSWRGSAASSDITTQSGLGTSNYQMASGVTSCVGCAFDSASRDCVCQTCYNNYN